MVLIESTSGKSLTLQDEIYDFFHHCLRAEKHRTKLISTLNLRPDKLISISAIVSIILTERNNMDLFKWVNDIFPFASGP